MVDGLYLREMASKIKRGLAGQLERGFSTGSVTFGYRTIEVTAPQGQSSRGRVKPLGYRVEIVPEEAAAIVRIFELYASGLGVTSVVDQLNRAHVPGPRGERWKRGAIARLIENEKLLGRLVWGQRRFERRPGTRQKVARSVPRDQWRILGRRAHGRAGRERDRAEPVSADGRGRSRAGAGFEGWAAIAESFWDVPAAFARQREVH
jgi:hypothetical protein